MVEGARSSSRAISRIETCAPSPWPGGAWTRYSGSESNRNGRGRPQGRSGRRTASCSPPRSAPRSIPSHVRRDFRNAIRDAQGLDPSQWTPRELRHSFVSLLSDNGIPLEEISRLVGHSSTAVTEAVYRKQIRPVLQAGAVAMDQIFGEQ
ncbi:tyrosine-type recombinase/integrase [Sphaerisporangium flaviroseum]|uniref:tyrosine-type recombinase/integrase n=1 Tax=Sphaerisporangium flaviroseum TaxID=509199 RepID=UPI0031F0CF62